MISCLYSCKKEVEQVTGELEKGTVNDVEGYVYQTIKIGEQWWMAENLRTTKFNDGENIPLVTENLIWARLSTPGYCWYNNDYLIYGSVYGALYNWYAVNTRELCPSGWHIPSDNEWHNLALYLDPHSVWAGNTSESMIAGGKLKESGITHWLNPNAGATNEIGFSALPGGARWNTSGKFLFVGETGYWSCTDVFRYRALSYKAESLFRGYGENSEIGSRVGNSIRCIKD